MKISPYLYMLVLFQSSVALAGPAVAQIPEPGVSGLLALGGVAGLLVYLSRRKK